MRSSVLFLALWVAVGAQAELRDIQACVESNMPRLSTVQQLGLDVEENGDKLMESRLTLYWRRVDDRERRILLRFREPDDLSGAGLLVHRRGHARPTVHIYFPDEGAPRLISSRREIESFLGRANLGVDEMSLLLSPLSGRGITVVDEAKVLSGRQVWVLEELEADEDARYPRTLLFIDQEYCIPLRAEFYDEDGEAAKVLEIDPEKVTRIAQSWVPMQVIFHDQIRARDTILRMENVEVDKPLAPSLLTVESLPKLSR